MVDEESPSGADNVVALKPEGKPRGKAARYGSSGTGVLAHAREILEMELPPDHELMAEAKKLARWGMLNPGWHENARIGAARLLRDLIDGGGSASSGQGEPATREDWELLERYAAEKAREAG